MEDDNSEDDPYDHNDIKQYFSACEFFVFRPETVSFFLIWHDHAKLLKIKP